jgi:ABC-type uncharacterized transport system permease subunit
MTEQSVISILGGVGFAVAGIASYPHSRRPTLWITAILRVAACLAIAADILHLFLATRRVGLVEALQGNFSAAVLMGMLVGLVALGAHLSAKLKGLDGFLFGLAAILSFLELATIYQPTVEMTSRPWFISHGLAFSLSATFFIAGGAAGVAYLLVSRMLRRKNGSRLVGSVASLESLERFGRWMPIIGFPLFTYGILTGLCGVAHRPDLKHSTWYLDPTFMLSVIAWVVYAYLTIASLYGPHIRARRAAMLSTYGLGLIVVAFFVREFSSRLHQ